MNYPTIKQLRYFIALVDNNHFGNAAKSCFVSQSAFSVAIKELENILNGRLVDRTNKSVTITNLGKATYLQAKIVMHEISHLVSLSHAGSGPLSGKLALGIIPSIAPFMMSTIVLKIQKQYPQLELYLHEDITLKLYEKLMQGDLDVLLIALPYSLKNVEYTSIFKDYFHLAYMKNSKWVKTDGNTVQPINESVLLLEDGHCMREHTLAACELKDFNKVSQYTASSILTLLEMVKSDIGITYLPEMSIHSTLVEQSGLSLQKLNQNSYREIGLVWRKGSSRIEEFKLLADFIQKNH